jgi:hypothetical protein
MWYIYWFIGCGSVVAIVAAICQINIRRDKARAEAASFAAQLKQLDDLENKE